MVGLPHTKKHTSRPGHGDDTSRIKRQDENTPSDLAEKRCDGHLPDKPVVDLMISMGLQYIAYKYKYI